VALADVVAFGEVNTLQVSGAVRHTEEEDGDIPLCGGCRMGDLVMVRVGSST
jgi:hypothetical protein